MPSGASHFIVILTIVIKACVLKFSHLCTSMSQLESSNNTRAVPAVKRDCYFPDEYKLEMYQVTTILVSDWSALLILISHWSALLPVWLHLRVQDADWQGQDDGRLHALVLPLQR